MKKTISTILLLLIVFGLFAPTKVLADSNASTGHNAEEVGRQIANWSIDFYNNHKNQCHYDTEFNGKREAAYNAQINDSSQYYFDCVGWVSFAVHHATGLGAESFTYFAQPQSAKVFNGFEHALSNVRIYSEADGLSMGMRPGDILIKSTFTGGQHVGIYVGNDTVLHSINSSSGNDLRSDTVASFATGGYGGSDGSVVDYVGRVSESAAQSADFEFVADGVILPSDGGDINLDDQEFEFNGMPSDVSYGGKTTLDWFFNQIAQFFSFLLGTIINIIKMSILGYIGLAESLINSLIYSTEQPINGQEVSYINIKDIEYLSSNILSVEEDIYYLNPIEAYANEGEEQSQTEEDNRYTIEDVIYNRIPVLDVNVFTDTPGGEPIEQNSIVGILRKAVATWYVSFRNLAILALAIIIIYLGIRMALSTIPEKTGQYKTALGAWVISVVLIFIIHYFMIAVMDINDWIVNLFENASSNELSIYHTIQTRAMDDRIYIGIPATIMYLVLIVYFFRFLFVYVKRYFTIMILIIIAPFVCVKYAFDSAKGKKGSSIVNWMYDLTFNVLLQSVHALLYTVLMGIAIDMAVTNVWGFIISLILINFILKADSLFMNIFNFGRSANVADVDKKFSKEDIAGAISAYYITKKGLQAGWKGTKYLARTGGIAARNAYETGIRAAYGEDAFDEFSIRQQRRIDTANKIDDFKNSLYKMSHKGKDSEVIQLRKLGRKSGLIGKAARKTLKARKSLKKKRFTANLNTAKDIPLSILGMGAAIPAFVISPAAGYAMFSKGLKKYRKLARPKWEGSGYKKKYHGKAKFAQFATLGVYGIYKNQEEATKKQEKKEGEITKTVEFIKQVDKHYEKAMQEWDAMSGNMTDEEKKQFTSKLKSTIVDGNETEISNSIFNYMNVNKEKQIDSGNIYGVIDNAINEIASTNDFTTEELNTVRARVVSNFDYTETKYVNQVKNIAETLHDAIIDINFARTEDRAVAIELDNIEKINQKAKSEVKTTVIDTKKLINRMKLT